MIAEIIGPSGRVHYRRQQNDPLVEEARRTPGYSVRMVALSHDEVARELLRSICGTTIDEDSGSKLISDALQNAFDLGFKAAGGTVG